ncbi:hypothetical protein, partial [Thiothrix caldifontis]
SSPVQSSPVQSSPEDNIDLTNFDEEYFPDEPNEPEDLGVIIDDSALKEKEDWFQSEIRNVENLKAECHALYKACHQKKQEIKAIKNNIAFSHDCKNDIETIYTNIETDTCENIKAHAADIGKNIRTNKNIAEMYLRNLKRDADLLSLQFDYTNIIEKFSITCSEWNKRQKVAEDVRVRISGFEEIRERMRQRALSEQEDRRRIMEIEEIINQR